MRLDVLDRDEAVAFLRRRRVYPELRRIEVIEVRYEAGPAGGRLRRPSSAGSTTGSESQAQ